MTINSLLEASSLIEVLSGWFGSTLPVCSKLCIQSKLCTVPRETFKLLATPLKVSPMHIIGHFLNSEHT